MMIDDQTFGRLTPQKMRKLIRQYRREAAKAAGKPPDHAVSSTAAVSQG
jgi:ribosomal 50S subunit-associated protein YjgA (DUF615 family)